MVAAAQRVQVGLTRRPAITPAALMVQVATAGRAAAVGEDAPVGARPHLRSQRRRGPPPGRPAGDDYTVLLGVTLVVVVHHELDAGAGAAGPQHLLGGLAGQVSAQRPPRSEE